MYRKSIAIILIALTALAVTGCEVLPQTRLKPVLRNPFPQMTTVAVVPFFDCTGEQYANGLEFAQAYAAELQRVPGFDVTPVTTVKETMAVAKIVRFESVEDIRTLGRLLNVDAVLVGYINEYSPYYPMKVGIKVEWYATNPDWWRPIKAGEHWEHYARRHGEQLDKASAE